MARSDLQFAYVADSTKSPLLLVQKVDLVKAYIAHKYEFCTNSTTGTINHTVTVEREQDITVFGVACTFDGGYELCLVRNSLLLPDVFTVEEKPKWEYALRCLFQYVIFDATADTFDYWFVDVYNVMC